MIPTQDQYDESIDPQPPRSPYDNGVTRKKFEEMLKAHKKEVQAKAKAVVKSIDFQLAKISKIDASEDLLSTLSPDMPSDGEHRRDAVADYYGTNTLAPEGVKPSSVLDRAYEE